MEREFTQGFNQLPSATIVNDIYPIRAKLKTGEAVTELMSVLEITDFDNDDNIYKVKRPSQNNIPPMRLVFGAGHTSEADDHFSVGMNDVRWVIYDYDEFGYEPEVGDFVGTVEDSYKLGAYKFGFEVIDYDTTNELVLVRPQSLMPLFVKATSNESGGKVDVKFAEYDGTTVGDSFEVYVMP